MLRKNILYNINASISNSRLKQRIMLLSSIFVVFMLLSVPIVMPMSNDFPIQPNNPSYQSGETENEKTIDNHPFPNKILEIPSQLSDSDDEIINDIFEYFNYLRKLKNKGDEAVMNEQGDFKSPYFAYYWIHYLPVRFIIQATHDCDSYDEFYSYTVDYFMKGGFLKEEIGFLILISSVLLVWSMLPNSIPGLSMTSWLLLAAASLNFAEYMFVFLTCKNQFDALWTKAIDIILKIEDEDGNPLNLTKLPYAYNIDIKNTLLWQNNINDQWNGITDDLMYRFSHELGRLNDIDYPNEEDPPINYKKFPYPDGTADEEGWYTLSSRTPNVAYDVAKPPSPPGIWNVTIPDQIIGNTLYHGRKFNTSDIIANSLYIDIDIKLKKNTTVFPYAKIITPQPGETETSLLTPLVFTVHDNQTKEDEYINVKVYTNDTDDGHWEDLTELYDISTGKHPGEEVYIPTDNPIITEEEEWIFFDEYNTTYYWKINLTDNDNHPELGDFNTEKIYSFTTIGE